MNKRHISGFSKFLMIAALLAVFAAEGQEKKPGYRPTTRRKVAYEQLQEGGNITQISDNKVKFIREVVQSYVDFKDDITNQTYDQIEKEFKIQPEGKPDNRTIQELRAEALRLIKKDFPMEEAEYRKMLETRADKIYATIKNGEKVTLTYIKNRRRYKVTDVFYGFNGSTVKIGLRTLPFYDLIEEDKIRVSESYAKRRRAEYVQKELSDYLKKRQEALLSMETKLVNDQLKHNINGGFVLYLERWRYPIQVINNFLIRSIEADSRYAGKVTGLNLDSIQRIQIKFIESFDRNKLADRIQARKVAALKYKGTIDSAQGFLDLVFWGFTRDEVKHLLEAQGLNFIPGKEYDRAFTSDRQVKESRLYYKDNRLVKVVTIYNVTTFDEYLSIRKNMLQNYGADNRTKQKAGYVRPGDPLSWSGLITDGHLYVKQNPETGAIAEPMTMTWQEVTPAQRRAREAQQKKGP